MCVCKSSNASAKIAEHMYTQEVPRITEKMVWWQEIKGFV